MRKNGERNGETLAWKFFKFLKFNPLFGGCDSCVICCKLQLNEERRILSKASIIRNKMNNTYL